MAQLIDTTVNGNLNVEGNISTTNLQIEDTELESLVTQLNSI